MFGILVAGRLPANNFERVSETQFLIQINDIESVNHLVVYMTGEMPFPDGFAGAVYFNYTVGNEARWIYLGKICNVKPSAIFKISNLKHESNDLAVQPFGSMNAGSSMAMIGISVEPMSQIDSLVPASQVTTNTLNTFTEFVQKMLQNFYNYASSFAKDGPDGQQYVPLITLQNWLDNFKRRFELNPNFWKS